MQCSECGGEGIQLNYYNNLNLYNYGIGLELKTKIHYCGDVNLPYVEEFQFTFQKTFLINVKIQHLRRESLPAREYMQIANQTTYQLKSLKIKKNIYNVLI